MTAKTPEQLVSVYGDTVYRLAYAQTRSRHDAGTIFFRRFFSRPCVNDRFSNSVGAREGHGCCG